MLWRSISSVVTLLLVLLLIVPVGVSAEGQDMATSLNVAYSTVVESASGVNSAKIYIKDDRVYLEMEGQLWVMDAFQDMILSRLEEVQEEMLDAVEVREVGEELLDGQRTLHHQVFSKETGLLEHEHWQALDLPLTLALKAISYDSEGNVLSTTRIFDIEFDPDLSGINFSSALSFSCIGKSSDNAFFNPGGVQRAGSLVRSFPSAFARS